jgi:hypothetical protein
MQKVLGDRRENGDSFIEAAIIHPDVGIGGAE